jgi:hypothetical protein
MKQHMAQAIRILFQQLGQFLTAKINHFISVMHGMNTMFILHAVKS